MAMAQVASHVGFPIHTQTEKYVRAGRQGGHTITKRRLLAPSYWKTFFALYLNNLRLFSKQPLAPRAGAMGACLFER